MYLSDYVLPVCGIEICPKIKATDGCTSRCKECFVKIGTYRKMIFFVIKIDTMVGIKGNMLKMLRMHVCD